MQKNWWTYGSKLMLPESKRKELHVNLEKILILRNNSVSSNLSLI